ncbi:MAG: hypothetical protein ACXWQE_02465 [Bdellovibrionales bacterium]
MNFPWLKIFIAIAAIMGLAGAAHAESLQAIRIASPVDGRDADLKCDLAYQQISKDRLEKEARENFFCLKKIDQKFLDGIEAEFKILCMSSILYGEADSGFLTVDTAKLNTSFFQAYKPYASTCIDGALAEFNTTGSMQDIGNEGSGAAMRESGPREYKPGCYEGRGCL